MDILRLGKKNEAQYSQLVEEQRDIFLKNAAVNRLPQDLERIRQAYEYAFQAHARQTRKAGEPYILHPIAVARIVNEEMGLGTNPIIASLLHDVAEDTSHTVEDIRELFGEDIAYLVEGLTKEKGAIRAVHTGGQHPQDVDDHSVRHPCAAHQAGRQAP